MSFLRYPRLPQGKVTHVLVSGEYPWLKASLEQRGIQVIETTVERCVAAKACEVSS